MQQIVKWAQGKIELIVSEATVADEIAAGAIRRNLTDYVVKVIGKDNPDATWGQWEQFATYCVQTRRSMGLSFQPELARGLRGEALYAAYCGYLEMARTLRNKWAKACEDADAVGDVELAPTPPEDASPEA